MSPRQAALAAVVVAVLLTGCADDDGESINPRVPEPAPTAGP